MFSDQRGKPAATMGKPLKENMTDKTGTTETPNEDVSDLKANNAELRKSLRDEKDKNRDLEARLTKIEQEREDAADSTKSEHDKELGKLQRQIDKLTGDLTARDTRLGELLIDNAIKEAISSNNVLPQFAKAVEAMLRAGAKIENGEAIAADGTPLADANAAFFQSADAKHFVAANTGTGAGATGNASPNVAGSKWTKPPVTGTEMRDWAHEAVANPVEFNALAKGWGRPDLEV